MSKIRFKKLFLIFLLTQLFLSYQTVYAQQGSDFDYGKNAGIDKQITQYLCAPNAVPESQTNNASGNPYGGIAAQTNAAFNNNNSGILFKCINQIYKFAIVVSAVVGVFFIVIAGYIYMSSDGDAEAVTKAKDILRTTIASIVILLGGYVLLKALNPDLIQFHSIQPPSVDVTAVSAPGAITYNNSSGGVITGTGPSCYIIDGYNIAPYATAPTHEQVVTQVFNAIANKDFSTAAGIDQYMKSIAPKTPLTGAMVISAAQSSGTDPKMLVAMMQVDSSLGTAGVATTTFNPGNVGNTDNGSTKNWGSWQNGVAAVGNWLAAHKQSSC